MRRMPATLAAALVAVALAGCEREERRLRELPPAADRSESGAVRQTELQPGPRTPDRDVRDPYRGNAWSLTEGQRLYSAYNCVGCHAHGGGGMGPPLMDDLWIYGSDPENVFDTIVEGRPNGMPSFRGKVADYQVWQLVAYVRTLSGLAPSVAAPGRSDHMQVGEPLQSREAVRPKPGPAEHVR